MQIATVRRLLIGIAIVLPIATLLLAQRSRPGGAEARLPIYWSVPRFSLLDQDSAQFTDAQLRGHTWVASFVYTQCPDVCPLVTNRMAALRDELRADQRLGQVRLLSITVDPVRDTPGVLRDYASKFAAQKPDWVFLTGTLETVIPLVNDGFHLTALHPARHDEHEPTHQHDAQSPDYTVVHSDRLVLIDETGSVRGTYATTDTTALQQLRRDLANLTR